MTRQIPVETIRHVTPDFEPFHLVTTDDPNIALCREAVGGLRPAGSPVDTPAEAAKLATWINVRDEMCDSCKEAFNDAVFEGELI